MSTLSHAGVSESMGNDPVVYDAGIFASFDPLLLAGSRCLDCAVTVFPAAGSCPSCAGTSVERVALPAQGTIWSWTVQRLAPKAPFTPPPGGFRPFVVGYVDLGDVLVESRLAVELADVAIGMPVRLALSTDLGERATFVFEWNGFEPNVFGSNVAEPSA